MGDDARRRWGPVLDGKGLPEFFLEPNFGETLATALEHFHLALTKRWGEIVCQAILDAHEPEGGHDFPTTLVASPPLGQPGERHLWDYRHPFARAHLAGDGYLCSYVTWVRGGQEGDLSSVRCNGEVAFTVFELAGYQVKGELGYDRATGETHELPTHIDCGMGSILRNVEDWAWAERTHVFEQLPLFDHHDLTVLAQAHDNFLMIGKALGLEPAAGSAPGVMSLSPASESDITSIITAITGKGGVGPVWWEGWTGLAADSAQSGFFASCVPTASNQSDILGALANLYSDRSAIVVTGRTGALYQIQAATRSLAETGPRMVDIAPGWKVVTGIGIGIGVAAAVAATGGLGTAAAAGAGTAGTVGTTLELVGFLGENLADGWEEEAYSHDLLDVVQTLNNRIEDLNRSLDSHETDYGEAISTLRNWISGIHSFELELYDFTQNSASGGVRTAAHTETYVLVDNVLEIARACHRAGKGYSDLLPLTEGTVEADPHLASQDGTQLPADLQLIEVRDWIDGFLRTACSRYLVAGDQVIASAEEYKETDAKQQANFQEVMSDWEAAGGPGYDVGFDPTNYIDSTRRGYNTGDIGDYVTEQSG